MVKELNRDRSLFYFSEFPTLPTERLGFVREGTRRGYSWEEDGTFHDSVIYGLLCHEWKSGEKSNAR